MSEPMKKKSEQTPESYSPKVKPEILSMAEENAGKIRLAKAYEVKTANGGSYIDGVSMLKWGEWRDNTYVGAITMAMDIIGQPVGYEYVMGVTGLCFRFGMSEDWCPGAPLAQHGPLMDDNNTNAAIGVVIYSISDSNERDKKLRDELDTGRPVICMGQNGPPEWGLLTGYTGDGSIFGRCYFDKQECGRTSDRAVKYTENRYLKANDYPGMVPEYFVRFFDRPCQKADPKQVLKNSLSFCLNSFDDAWDKYKIGEEAYRIFIRGMQLSDDDYRRVCGNDQYFLGILLDAGRAAQMYIKNSAPLLTDENQNRMLSIAALYKKMNTAILDAIPYEKTSAVFDEGSSSQWEKPFRDKLADVLSQNIEHEKQLRMIVKDILDNWEDER